MATPRQTAAEEAAPPTPKRRLISRKEAKALLAAGGWTLDPENTIPGEPAYVSEQGQLLYFNSSGSSMLYASRQEHRTWWEALKKLPPRVYSHVLEDLLPQGPHFIESIPGLLDELAVLLKLPREALDGSWESLRIVDKALKKVRPRRRILEVPNFFAGLIAYIGEVFRGRSGGHWELNEVHGGIWEPYVRYGPEYWQEINPWIHLAKCLNERSMISLEAIVAGLLMSKGLA